MKTKTIRFIQQNITVFPVLTALILPVLCIFIYELSLYYGHADRYFPFISDSASSEPEAEFFTLLTWSIAITMVITGYGRFRQLQYYIDTIESLNEQSGSKLTPAQVHHWRRKLRRFNVTALIAFWCSAFGAATTGVFPVSTHLYPHCFGVFMIGLMTVGEIYMILLGHQLHTKFGVESYPWSMGFIWLTQFITGAIVLFATLTSIFQAGYDNLTDSEFRLHWKPWAKGYRTHLLSAVMEWVTLNLNNLYMVCLYQRMKHFQHWDKVWAVDREQKDRVNNNNNHIHPVTNGKSRID